MPERTRNLLISAGLLALTAFFTLIAITIASNPRCNGITYWG